MTDNSSGETLGDTTSLMCWDETRDSQQVESTTEKTNKTEQNKIWQYAQVRLNKRDNYFHLSKVR